MIQYSCESIFSVFLMNIPEWGTNNDLVQTIQSSAFHMECGTEKFWVFWGRL